MGRTGGANYSYNAKNKLVAMTGVGITASYQYNIDGIRNAKVENGQAVNYLVDQNRDYAQVITESTATNVTDYTYGDDLLSQNRQGQTFTYHYDGLGSTRLLTDELGNNTDSYDYEAFGETLNRTGTIENSYLYAGEQFDSGLDNYYLRARYYDQGVGRFTQQDTWQGNAQDPVTLHKYLYGNVDPVNHVDPSGNFSLASVGAAVRTIGSLARSAGQSAWSAALRGGSKIKGKVKKEWAIYHIKLGTQYLGHEFIWAKNTKTKKGIGYHIWASRSDVRHSILSGDFVSGAKIVIKQNKPNSALGRTFKIKSKTLIGYLGKISFVGWSMTTVGLMSVGDSCPFNYQIPTSNCITWTKKTARKARIFSAFPF